MAVFFLGRPFILGATALAFGALMLSFNLIGEYQALDETTSVADLPTWHSMMKRMGLIPSFNIAHEQVLSWPIFLESQFQILGRMFLPVALSAQVDALLPDDHLGLWAWMDGLLFPFGIAALAICLVWLRFSRQRVLLATLALSGFVWSMPMRHTAAFHDFEGVFYVGVPLTLFALALLHMHRLSSERPMPYVAVVALLVFVFSGWQMNSANEDARAFHAEVMSDFDAIRSGTEGAAVGIMVMGDLTGAIHPSLAYRAKIPIAIGAPFALEYYLSRRAIMPLRWPMVPDSDMEKLDFIVTDWREPATLTPENRRFHLYSRSAFVQSSRPDTLPGDLLARGKFDIYKNAYALIHVKSPCTEADVAAPFAVHLWPVDKADLPEYRRQFGFDNLDFSFGQRGKTLTTRGVRMCVAWTKLPAYRVERVGTGQYDESGSIWWLDVPLAQ